MQLRTLSSLLMCAFVMLVCPLCEAQTINTRAVSFLNERIARRVGGGECTDAIAEALRVAGGEFDRTDLGPDRPFPGNFVWGNLKKTISFTGGKAVDSNPTAKLLPGDIVQYHNANFKIGTIVIQTVQHTAMVAAVDISGKATFVLQQNFSGTRAIRKDAIDFMKITSGFVNVYSPKARRDVSRRFKFTIVNNTTTDQVVKLRNGIFVGGQLTLRKTNTTGSFNSGAMTTAGSVNQPNFLITSSNATLATANAGAYELFRNSAGTVAFRRLIP